MTSPLAPTQKGIITALKASAALAVEMGGTVNAYDRVPDNPAASYIHISNMQALDLGNSCEPWMAEVLATIQIWTSSFGKVGAERIGDLVTELLADELQIDNWICLIGTREDENYFFDGDGVTGRGVLTFRYLVQPS